MMNHQTDWQAYWLETLQTWEDRIEAAGLGGITRAILDAAQPLIPLLAQLIWFAQPVFGMIGQDESVGILAEMLYSPDEFRQSQKKEGSENG
jgi:hypothetical protein